MLEMPVILDVFIGESIRIRNTGVNPGALERKQARGKPLYRAQNSLAQR